MRQLQNWSASHPSRVLTVSPSRRKATGSVLVGSRPDSPWPPLEENFIRLDVGMCINSSLMALSWVTTRTGSMSFSAGVGAVARSTPRTSPSARYAAAPSRASLRPQHRGMAAQNRLEPFLWAGAGLAAPRVLGARPANVLVPL